MAVPHRVVMIQKGDFTISIFKSILVIACLNARFFANDIYYILVKVMIVSLS